MKISVTADKLDGSLGTKDFYEAANYWYRNGGKASLEEYFNKTLGQVIDRSYLKNFVFGDTVDKESYD